MSSAPTAAKSLDGSPAQPGAARSPSEANLPTEIIGIEMIASHRAKPIVATRSRPRGRNDAQGARERSQVAERSQFADRSHWYRDDCVTPSEANRGARSLATRTESSHAQDGRGAASGGRADGSQVRRRSPGDRVEAQPAQHSQVSPSEANLPTEIIGIEVIASHRAKPIAARSRPVPCLGGPSPGGLKRPRPAERDARPPPWCTKAWSLGQFSRALPGVSGTY